MTAVKLSDTGKPVRDRSFRPTLEQREDAFRFWAQAQSTEKTAEHFNWKHKHLLKISREDRWVNRLQTEILPAVRDRSNKIVELALIKDEEMLNVMRGKIYSDLQKRVDSGATVKDLILVMQMLQRMKEGREIALPSDVTVNISINAISARLETLTAEEQAKLLVELDRRAIQFQPGE